MRGLLWRLSLFLQKTAKPTDVRPSALLLKKDIKKNIEDVVIRVGRNNSGIICHNRCYYSISISYVSVSMQYTYTIFV